MCIFLHGKVGNCFDIKGTGKEQTEIVPALSARNGESPAAVGLLCRRLPLPFCRTVRRTPFMSGSAPEIETQPFLACIE